jgi:hypothetical protein
MLSSPPPTVDLNEDQAIKIRGIFLSTWSLSIIAVILRLVSRKISNLSYGMDDWLIVMSMVRFDPEKKRSY